MKKKNILKNSRDFDRIIKNSKPYKYKDYIIFLERKTTDVYHFGISVGNKIGNAVVRNKIKRQIKSMIDKNKYKSYYNIVIIVRKNYLKNNFIDNEKILFDVFNNFKIIYNEEE